jgi:hypothetical protein
VTNLATEKLDLDNILLNQITQTANSGVGTVPNNQLYVRQWTFLNHIQITRPANTTAYVLGSIINNNASSILPIFNFTSYNGSIPTRTIRIKEIQVASSGSPRNITWIITNSATMGAQVFTDNTLFNPVNSDYFANSKEVFTNLPTSLYGGNFTQSQSNSNIANLNSQIDIDAGNKLYLIPIVATAFTPNSAEIFDITIKGEVY